MPAPQTTVLLHRTVRRSGRTHTAGATVVLPTEEARAMVRRGDAVEIVRRPPRRDRQIHLAGIVTK